MPTAVHGETHLRAHCVFKFQEDVGGARVYSIDPSHCLACLVELRRMSPTARLSWLDLGGSTTRRIGNHCEFRSEQADDVQVRGQAVRMFWIEPIHCEACIELARELFGAEPGSILVDRRPTGAAGKVAPSIRRS